MSVTCPCSGPLVAEESQQDFHKTMQLLRYTHEIRDQTSSVFLDIRS